MASREYCETCERYVGGGVTHDENCEDRGKILRGEKLTYNCSNCGSVGYVDNKIVKHNEGCDKKGEFD